MIGLYTDNVAIFCKSPLQKQILRNQVFDNIRTFNKDVTVSIFTDNKRTRLIKIVSKESMDKIIGKSYKLS